MAGYNKNTDVELTLRKLFVGGLRPDTTDDEFKDFFATFGEIEDYVHIRNKETRQSKCFGFVTYANQEDVDTCLAAKPHKINGKEVDVKRAVPKDQPQERCQKIFVGGLPETNEKELKEFFEKHGKVTQCQFKRDQSTGRGRGFGFVSFEEFDTVDKLVIMKHMQFQGKTIECKKALDVKDKPMLSNGGPPPQNPSIYGPAPPQYPMPPAYGAYPPPHYHTYAVPPAGPAVPPVAPGFVPPPVAPGYGTPYAVPAAVPGYPVQPAPYPAPVPYHYPTQQYAQQYAQQAPSSYGAQKNTYTSNTYNSSRSANYKPY